MIGRSRLKAVGPWIMTLIGAVFFIVPLVGTLELSLRMRRGVYSFDAYAWVFIDPGFLQSFAYSAVLAVFTIALGTALIVPTAYWVRLRLPHLRPIIEFITLMPLVIPAIVIVFGYIRMYNSSSFLPLTNSNLGTDTLLTFAYVTLALPYMYRAVDTGLGAIDVRTLSEAAESLGANRLTIIAKVILPNLRTAILSGAFLTLAIVVGEYIMASILNRQVLGVYLQNMGANKPYQSWALTVITFAITWGAMGLMSWLGRDPRTQTRH